MFCCTVLLWLIKQLGYLALFQRECLFSFAFLKLQQMLEGITVLKISQIRLKLMKRDCNFRNISKHTIFYINLSNEVIQRILWNSEESHNGFCEIWELCFNTRVRKCFVMFYPLEDLEIWVVFSRNYGILTWFESDFVII